MQVRFIDTGNSKDVDKFVDFPFRLYAENQLWVPPLVSSARKILNKEKHPFYAHSEADFLLAEEGGRVIGRLSVMENRNFNDYRQTKAAFFGYMEVVEDEAVSQALFSKALAWARERGLDTIMGPRGLIPNEATGMLVEGFEHRPAMNIPYNFPYYDELVKAAGFRKDTDHISGYLPGDYELPERVLRIADKIRDRRGMWIKHFEDKDEIRPWIPRVFEVYGIAFSDSHTYYPPTEAEQDMIAESILQIIDPGLVKGVMKGEKLIGFIISYYDLSAALQRCRGRIWPFGWYWLMMERRRTKWANVNGAGLLPEYQGLGANVLLYTELAKTIHEYGFESADLVLVNETNTRSLADMEAVGVKWYKRHRAYIMEL
jgi:ribosomal protein S18 acetylase RimI-like enzyme